MTTPTQRLAELGLTLPGFVERSKVIASLPSLGLLYLAASTPPGHEVQYYEAESDGAEPAEIYSCDLVAISTFAQLLPERYTDDEFRKQFHEIVTAEVQRLNAIISQINAFAHPPATVLRPVAPARLAELARVQAAHLLPGENRPRVESQIDPGLPEIRADEQALAHGLAHLLVNAQEAVQGRTAAHVALHVRRAGSGDVAFAGSDNGPGIAAAVRNRIFSPFGTTKPRGLGLGLPLARRAVVDHGGRIDVDSTPNGTTVTVTLPVEGGRRTDA